MEQKSQKKLSAIDQDQARGEEENPTMQEVIQKETKKYEFPPDELLKKSIFISERYSWYGAETLEQNLKRRGNLLHFFEKIVKNKDNTNSFCYYAIFDDEELVNSLIEKKKIKVKVLEKSRKTKIAIFKCTKNRSELQKHVEIHESRFVTIKYKEDRKNGNLKLSFAKREKIRIKELKKKGLYDPVKEAEKARIRKENARNKKARLKEQKRLRKQEAYNKKRLKILRNNGKSPSIKKKKKKKKKKDLKKIKLKKEEEGPTLDFGTLGMTPEQVQMMAYIAMSITNMNNTSQSTPIFIPQETSNPTVNIKSVNIEGERPKSISLKAKTPLINKNSQPFHPYFFPGSPSAEDNTFFKPESQREEVKERFKGAGVIQDGEEIFFRPTEKNYYKSNLRRRMHFESTNLWNFRLNWSNLRTTGAEN